MAKKQIVVHAQKFFDGKTVSDNKTLLIAGDRITEISKSKVKADYTGFVTPAFIDAHSHIGMFRSGEPGNEQEGNDFLQQISPLCDPVNSIYFDDHAFIDAVDFGVLYSCVMPGSGNLFGGKSTIIKNFAQNRSQAIIKDFGFKMALGYNPRATTDWRGERPNTRMGIYDMLEKRFDAIKTKSARADVDYSRKIRELERKVKKKDVSTSDAQREREDIQKEFSLALTEEDRAINDLLQGKKSVKVHVHKEDDVYYLIHLVKKYGLKVSAEHTGDVFHKEVFADLADNNIPVIYGPLGSFPYKVELLHHYYQNARLLMESGVRFGLMSDHPVIHVSALRESLKFFLIQGMSEADALSIITRRNAEILGIDDTLGTLAVGKKASLLVWPQSPLHLAAYPETVIAEGNVLREKSQGLVPHSMRKAVA